MSQSAYQIQLRKWSAKPKLTKQNAVGKSAKACMCFCVCTPVYAFVHTCMSRRAQIQYDTELGWF